MSSTGGAGELRAWLRWLRRTEHPTVRWRLRMASDPVLLPWRAAMEALRGVRAYGASVAERHGISRARQAAELWSLGVRHGIGADSYYRFQIFRPERRRQAADYVDGRDYELLMRQLLRDLPRDDRETTRDKLKFARWAAEHGLPAVPTLLVVAPDGTSVPAHPELPPADLFSKPVDLASGKGVARWRHQGAGRWQRGDEPARGTAELIAELARAAAEVGRAIVVQPALRNHPEVARLSAGGLCTARMVTVRPRDGGPPALLFAVLRMPVGDAVADNFDGGGVAAGVDTAAGRLRTGLRKDARFLAEAVERHPTTGTPIAGHQLPDWDAAVAVVCRGHEAMPPSLPVVGWDLAFTDGGPVLVEGNAVPGINLMQMPLDVPLGATALVPTILEHLRAHYGVGAPRGAAPGAPPHEAPTP